MKTININEAKLDSTFQTWIQRSKTDEMLQIEFSNLPNVEMAVCHNIW